MERSETGARLVWPRNREEAAVAGTGFSKGRGDGGEGRDAAGGLVLCGPMWTVVGLWVCFERKRGHWEIVSVF